MEKPFIKVIALISIVSSYSVAQNWQAKPVNAGISLKDIYAKDESNVLLVGSKGVIVSTNDGGNTYTMAESGTEKQLTSVSCTDMNCFVLAGDEILVSSDNQNWSKYPLPSYGGSEIYFFNNEIGYITGAAPGEILKSTNGGVIWEVVKTNMPERYINAVQFINEQEGYAISQDYNKQTQLPIASILKTSDGGLTWTQVHEKTGFMYKSICFTSQTTGYAVGSKGIIVKTTDAGNTWTELSSNTNENLRAIKFDGTNVGFVVGTKGTVLKTINQGITWTTQDTGKPYLFTSLSMVDANKVFLLVESHLMLKTETGGI